MMMSVPSRSVSYANVDLAGDNLDDVTGANVTPLLKHCLWLNELMYKYTLGAYGSARHAGASPLNPAVKSPDDFLSVADGLVAEATTTGFSDANVSAAWLQTADPVVNAVYADYGQVRPLAPSGQPRYLALPGAFSGFATPTVPVYTGKNATAAADWFSYPLDAVWEDHNHTVFPDDGSLMVIQASPPLPAKQLPAVYGPAIAAEFAKTSVDNRTHPDIGAYGLTKAELADYYLNGTVPQRGGADVPLSQGLQNTRAWFLDAMARLPGVAFNQQLSVHFFRKDLFTAMASRIHTVLLNSEMVMPASLVWVASTVSYSVKAWIYWGYVARTGAPAINPATIPSLLHGALDAGGSLVYVDANKFIQVDNTHTSYGWKMVDGNGNETVTVTGVLPPDLPANSTMGPTGIGPAESMIPLPVTCDRDMNGDKGHYAANFGLQPAMHYKFSYVDAGFVRVVPSDFDKWFYWREKEGGTLQSDLIFMGWAVVRDSYAHDGTTATNGSVTVATTAGATYGFRYVPFTVPLKLRAITDNGVTQNELGFDLQDALDAVSSGLAGSPSTVTDSWGNVTTNGSYLGGTHPGGGMWMHGYIVATSRKAAWFNMATDAS